MLKTRRWRNQVSTDVTSVSCLRFRFTVPSPSVSRRRLRSLHILSYSSLVLLARPVSQLLFRMGTAFGARRSRLESRCTCGGLLRQMRKRPNTAQKAVHCAVGCALDSWSSCMFLALKRAISTEYLLYRNRSRSACVAKPSLTRFSRFASASI
jgi:hypothetical protein